MILDTKYSTLRYMLVVFFARTERLCRARFVLEVSDLGMVVHDPKFGGHILKEALQKFYIKLKIIKKLLNF